VAGLTTDRYANAEAARDVRLFSKGARHDYQESRRADGGSGGEELFEQAAAYRDLLRTLEDIENGNA